MNERIINLCIDSLAADVADKIAMETGVTITAALQEFMKTKTYALLFDGNSLLYLESAEYVYDMLEAEQRGNWEYWMEE